MAVKPSEMLYLLPREELVFESSPNQTVWKQLSIQNPSKNHRVAFKLKNTLPPMFSVRPPTGVLEPSQSITVDIYMQPFIPDPGNKRPKFQIQAAIIADEPIELTEFWKMLRPEDIWSAKIKCKVVSNKYRQEGGGGGGDTIFPGYQQEDEEAFDSMAKLVKQVCVLEEEVHTLREQTKIFVNMAICVATVIAVILGANLIW